MEPSTILGILPEILENVPPLETVVEETTPPETVVEGTPPLETVAEETPPPESPNNPEEMSNEAQQPQSHLWQKICIVWLVGKSKVSGIFVLVVGEMWRHRLQRNYSAVNARNLALTASFALIVV